MRGRLVMLAVLLSAAACDRTELVGGVGEPAASVAAPPATAHELARRLGTECTATYQPDAGPNAYPDLIAESASCTFHGRQVFLIMYRRPGDRERVEAKTPELSDYAHWVAGTHWQVIDQDAAPGDTAAIRRLVGDPAAIGHG